MLGNCLSISSHEGGRYRHADLQRIVLLPMESSSDSAPSSPCSSRQGPLAVTAFFQNQSDCTGLSESDRKELFAEPGQAIFVVATHPPNSDEDGCLELLGPKARARNVEPVSVHPSIASHGRLWITVHVRWRDKARRLSWQPGGGQLSSAGLSAGSKRGKLHAAADLTQNVSYVFLTSQAFQEASGTPLPRGGSMQLHVPISTILFLVWLRETYLHRMGTVVAQLCADRRHFLDSTLEELASGAASDIRDHEFIAASASPSAGGAPKKHGHDCQEATATTAAHIVEVIARRLVRAPYFSCVDSTEAASCKTRVLVFYRSQAFLSAAPAGSPPAQSESVAQGGGLPSPARTTTGERGRSERTTDGPQSRGRSWLTRFFASRSPRPFIGPVISGGNSSNDTVGGKVGPSSPPTKPHSILGSPPSPPIVLPLQGNRPDGRSCILLMPAWSGSDSSRGHGVKAWQSALYSSALHVSTLQLPQGLPSSERKLLTKAGAPQSSEGIDLPQPGSSFAHMFALEFDWSSMTIQALERRHGNAGLSQAGPPKLQCLPYLPPTALRALQPFASDAARRPLHAIGSDLHLFAMNDRDDVAGTVNAEPVIEFDDWCKRLLERPGLSAWRAGDRAGICGSNHSSPASNTSLVARIVQAMKSNRGKGNENSPSSCLPSGGKQSPAFGIEDAVGGGRSASPEPIYNRLFTSVPLLICSRLLNNSSRDAVAALFSLEATDTGAPIVPDAYSAYFALALLASGADLGSSRCPASVPPEILRSWPPVLEIRRWLEMDLRSPSKETSAGSTSPGCTAATAGGSLGGSLPFDWSRGEVSVQRITHGLAPLPSTPLLQAHAQGTGIPAISLEALPLPAVGARTRAPCVAAMRVAVAGELLRPLEGDMAKIFPFIVTPSSNSAALASHRKHRLNCPLVETSTPRTVLTALSCPILQLQKSGNDYEGEGMLCFQLALAQCLRAAASGVSEAATRAIDAGHAGDGHDDWLLSSADVVADVLVRAAAAELDSVYIDNVLRSAQTDSQTRSESYRVLQTLDGCAAANDQSLQGLTAGSEPVPCLPHFQAVTNALVSATGQCGFVSTGTMATNRPLLRPPSAFSLLPPVPPSDRQHGPSQPPKEARAASVSAFSSSIREALVQGNLSHGAAHDVRGFLTATLLLHSITTRLLRTMRALATSQTPALPPAPNAFSWAAGSGCESLESGGFAWFLALARERHRRKACSVDKGQQSPPFRLWDDRDATVASLSDVAAALFEAIAVREAALPANSSRSLSHVLEGGIRSLDAACDNASEPVLGSTPSRIITYEADTLAGRAKVAVGLPEGHMAKNHSLLPPILPRRSPAGSSGPSPSEAARHPRDFHPDSAGQGAQTPTVVARTESISGGELAASAFLLALSMRHLAVLGKSSTSNSLHHSPRTALGRSPVVEVTWERQCEQLFAAVHRLAWNEAVLELADVAKDPLPQACVAGQRSVSLAVQAMLAGQCKYLFDLPILANESPLMVTSSDGCTLLRRTLAGVLCMTELAAACYQQDNALRSLLRLEDSTEEEYQIQQAISRALAEGDSTSTSPVFVSGVDANAASATGAISGVEITVTAQYVSLEDIYDGWGQHFPLSEIGIKSEPDVQTPIVPLSPSSTSSNGVGSDRRSETARSTVEASGASAGATRGHRFALLSCSLGAFPGLLALEVFRNQGDSGKTLGGAIMRILEGDAENCSPSYRLLRRLLLEGVTGLTLPVCDRLLRAAQDADLCDNPSNEPMLRSGGGVRRKQVLEEAWLDDPGLAAAIDSCLRACCIWHREYLGDVGMHSLPVCEVHSVLSTLRNSLGLTGTTASEADLSIGVVMGMSIVHALTTVAAALPWAGRAMPSAVDSFFATSRTRGSRQKIELPSPCEKTGLAAALQTTFPQLIRDIASLLTAEIAGAPDGSTDLQKLRPAWQVALNLVFLDVSARLCGFASDVAPHVRSEPRYSERKRETVIFTREISRAGLPELLSRLLSLEARAREAWLRDQEKEPEFSARRGEGMIGLGGQMSPPPLIDKSLYAPLSAFTDQNDVPVEENVFSLVLRMPLSVSDSHRVEESAENTMVVDPRTGMPLSQPERIIGGMHISADKSSIVPSRLFLLSSTSSGDSSGLCCVESVIHVHDGAISPQEETDFSSTNSKQTGRSRVSAYSDTAQSFEIVPRQVFLMNDTTALKPLSMIRSSSVSKASDRDELSSSLSSDNIIRADDAQIPRVVCDAWMGRPSDDASFVSGPSQEGGKMLSPRNAIFPVSSRVNDDGSRILASDANKILMAKSVDSSSGKSHRSHNDQGPLQEDVKRIKFASTRSGSVLQNIVVVRTPRKSSQISAKAVGGLILPRSFSNDSAFERIANEAVSFGDANETSGPPKATKAARFKDDHILPLHLSSSATSLPSVAENGVSTETLGFTISSLFSPSKPKKSNDLPFVNEGRKRPLKLSLQTPGGSRVPNLALPMSTKKGKGNFALLRDSTSNANFLSPKVANAFGHAWPFTPSIAHRSSSLFKAGPFPTDVATRLSSSGGETSNPSITPSVRLRSSSTAHSVGYPKPQNADPSVRQSPTVSSRPQNVSRRERPADGDSEAFFVSPSHVRSANVSDTSGSLVSHLLPPSLRNPSAGSGIFWSPTHASASASDPRTASVRSPSPSVCVPTTQSITEGKVSRRKTWVESLFASAETDPALRLIPLSGLPLYSAGSAHIPTSPQNGWTEIDKLPVGFRASSSATISYLDARNRSRMYLDPQLHSSVVIALMSCLLVPEGVAFRAELVDRRKAGEITEADFAEATRDVSLLMLRQNTKEDNPSNLLATDSSGAARPKLTLPPIFTGLRAEQLSAHQSSRAEPHPEAGNGGAAASSPPALGRAKGSFLVAAVAQARVQLRRKMTEQDLGDGGGARRPSIGRPTADPVRLADRLGKRPDPMAYLDRYPIYVLQCHLNHPSNLVLVNTHLKRMCDQRGAAFLRLLRLLSAEFFQPALYDLRNHIASGAYGSVVAALAAADSPASSRFAAIKQATLNQRLVATTAASDVVASAASGHLHSMGSPPGSSRAKELILSSLSSARGRRKSALASEAHQAPCSEDRCSKHSTAAAPAAGSALRHAALSPVTTSPSLVPLAAIQERHTSSPSHSPSHGSPAASPSSVAAATTRAHSSSSCDGASTRTPGRVETLDFVDDDDAEDAWLSEDVEVILPGETYVAVKILSFPDDPTEKCLLGDVLPEVAILEEMTLAFIESSSASSRSGAVPTSDFLSSSSSAFVSPSDHVVGPRDAKAASASGSSTSALSTSSGSARAAKPPETASAITLPSRPKRASVADNIIPTTPTADIRARSQIHRLHMKLVKIRRASELQHSGETKSTSRRHSLATGQVLVPLLPDLTLACCSSAPALPPESVHLRTTEALDLRSVLTEQAAEDMATYRAAADVLSMATSLLQPQSQPIDPLLAPTAGAETAGFAGSQPSLLPVEAAAVVGCFAGIQHPPRLTGSGRISSCASIASDTGVTAMFSSSRYATARQLALQDQTRLTDHKAHEGIGGPQQSDLFGAAVVQVASLMLDPLQFGCPTVCLLDYGVTSTAVWLVLEKCASSLRSWRLQSHSTLRRNNAAEARERSRGMEDAVSHVQLLLMLDLYACVLYRLGQLHDSGVTHYDVKCDNVMLREGYQEILARHARELEEEVIARSSAMLWAGGGEENTAQYLHANEENGSWSVRGPSNQSPEHGFGRPSSGPQWMQLLPYVCWADFGESSFHPGMDAAMVPLFSEGTSDNPEGEEPEEASGKGGRSRGTECIRAPELLLRAARAGRKQQRKSAVEQRHEVAAEGASGASCDAWSAGCLLYELVTGSYLFESGEDWARFYLTVTADQDLLSPEAAAALLDLPSADSRIRPEQPEGSGDLNCNANPIERLFPLISLQKRELVQRLLPVPPSDAARSGMDVHTHSFKALSDGFINLLSSMLVRDPKTRPNLSGMQRLVFCYRQQVMQDAVHLQSLRNQAAQVG